MSESSETPCPEKPRRSTQFKPGQSGNPLGRPKRKLGFEKLGLIEQIHRGDQSRQDQNGIGGRRSVNC